MPELNGIMTRRLVHEVPHVNDVIVRKDLIYKTAGDLTLEYDLYYPPVRRASPLPVVIFVHGDASPEIIRRAKDWGQYVSWGQLIAVTGFLAVTFNHRSSERQTKLHEVAKDVEDLFHHILGKAEALGINGESMCLWTCSTGPPLVLPRLISQPPVHVRCVVVYYGLMDLQHLREDTSASVGDGVLRQFSPLYQLERAENPIPPLLLVRAGLDDPRFNNSIDNFASAALRKNVPIEIINHPTGHHGFDVRDDTGKSREIIRRTVEFIQGHLRDSPGS